MKTDINRVIYLRCLNCWINFKTAVVVSRVSFTL